MSKRILTLLVLLAMVFSLFSLYFVNAQDDTTNTNAPATATPTAPTLPTKTATATACVVRTGYNAGTVNLRACGGTFCAVLDFVTEGEHLTVNAAGDWLLVTRADMTGYINSKYCK